MRPVNLLPQRYRAAGPSGGRSGSSYFLLGGLAAVLLGVVLYALTANQVSSREADADEARQAADAAEAEAGALAPFGDFRQVKDTRVEAVETLAEGRLDWERLARELAYVLPRGVRLDSVEGSTTGEVDGGAGAAAPAPPPPPESSAPASDDSSAPAPATPTADAAAAPTVVLEGCAESQRTVAKAVVRLRRLNGAQDVTLQDSSAAESGGATSDGGAGTPAGCPAFTFNATVQLAPATTPAAGLEAKAVPARLGGGL